jgi:hypothetical protein
MEGPQKQISPLDANKEIMKALEMDIGYGLPKYSSVISNIL